ncbi:MAG: recombination mediator RecR [Clostridiales bacterium]|jgi:recombination protein RecR|nr:recombination mediator RecR [Clostridiales bacterium]
MKPPIESVAALMARFMQLPGVGKKTAQRYAYAVLALPQEAAEAFAAAILAVKEKVHLCGVCGTFTDVDPCASCATGDPSVICVVEQPKDVLALQRVSGYRGTFHVLHGSISPMDGRTPDDLNIKKLVERVAAGNVTEVILATDPNVQGEVTAVYIARLLASLGVKTTRLAQGITMDTDLEYADEVTLSKALENRHPF